MIYPVSEKKWIASVEWKTLQGPSQEIAIAPAMIVK